MREEVVRIDPTVAGDHRLGDAVGAHEVGGPHAVGEAVSGAVHDFHGFIFLFEWQDIRDGAEDFFAARDVVAVAAKQRWLHVEAARVAFHRRGAAAQEHFGAFVFAAFEIAQDAAALLLTDHRSHLRGGIEAVADVQRGQRLRGAGDEAFVNFFVNEPARGRAADLTGVERERGGQRAGGVVHIDVIEQHGRAFAAEFEFHRHEIPAARFADQLADLGRAGERHALEAGMLRQRGPGGLAEAGDDIHHAVGDAGFLDELREVKGRERRVLGGLDDDGVARRQRGRDAPADEEQREIPRKNKAAHSVWQPHRAGLEARHRDRLATAGVDGEIGEITQRGRDVRDVAAARLRQRFAHVERFDLREDFAVFVHEIGEAMEENGAVIGGQRGPAALAKRFARRGDRAIHVVRVARRDGGDDLAVAGVAGLEGRAAGGVGPFAADEELEGLGAEEFFDCGMEGDHGGEGVDGLRWVPGGRRETNRGSGRRGFWCGEGRHARLVKSCKMKRGTAAGRAHLSFLPAAWRPRQPGGAGILACQLAGHHCPVFPVRRGARPWKRAAGMPPELAGKDACPTPPARVPSQVSSRTPPVPAEGCRKLRRAYPPPGSAPALGCRFPRPRGKLGRPENVRTCDDRRAPRMPGARAHPATREGACAPRIGRSADSAPSPQILSIPPPAVLSSVRTFSRQMNSDPTIIEGGGGTRETPGGAAVTILEHPAGAARTRIEATAAAPPGAIHDVNITPGGTFLGCQLLERIKVASGEAELWFARQPDGRPTVLKLYNWGLRPKAELGAKLSAVSRRHVVDVYAQGLAPDGRHYELLERIPHGSLADLAQPGLAEPRLREVLAELTDAVAALHAGDILHRDLKPANILVRTLTPLDLVLTDFGISSVAQLTLHVTGVHQTPAYSAPEAMAGVVSKASDWWSVGVIVLEILQGRHPWAGLDKLAIDFTKNQRGIEVPLGISEEWQLLLKGLLTRDLAKRWNEEQVRAWLAGRRDIAVHYESSSINLASYFSNGTGYANMDELGYAIGSASGTLWDEFAQQVNQGLVIEWVRDKLHNMNAASRLKEIAADGQLTPDLRVGLTAMVLNPNLPMTLRGRVLNEDLLVHEEVDAAQLLNSSLPEWIARLRSEPWLEQVRARNDQTLEFLDASHIEFDRALATRLAVCPIEHLVSITLGRISSSVRSRRPDISKLLKKDALSRKEAVLLAVCEPASLTTTDSIDPALEPKPELWLAPDQVGHGAISEKSCTIEFQVALPVECRIELHGYAARNGSIEPAALSPGIHTMRLYFDDLPEDSLVRGCVDLLHANGRFRIPYYAGSSATQTNRHLLFVHPEESEKLLAWQDSIRAAWTNQSSELIPSLSAMCELLNHGRPSAADLQNAKHELALTLETLTSKRLPYASCVQDLSDPQELLAGIAQAREALKRAGERRKSAEVIVEQLRELVGRGFYRQALAAAKAAPALEWLPDSETAFLKQAALQANKRFWRLILVSIAVVIFALFVVAVLVRNNYNFLTQ